MASLAPLQIVVYWQYKNLNKITSAHNVSDREYLTSIRPGMLMIPWCSHTARGASKLAQRNLFNIHDVVLTTNEPKFH